MRVLRDQVVKKLNLNAIRIDGGTQPRERIDMEVVGDYAEAVKLGIEFPPVIVFHDGAEYWLADGFHRWHAHKAAEKASIVADVRAGSLDDAKLFAAGCNGDHGLRRSNADKRLAVVMALGVKADWSDNKIASHVGVSHPFVADVRRSILKPFQDAPAVRTVERAGKTYKQDTSRIGKTAAAPAPAAAPTPAPAPAPAAEDFGPSEAEIAAAQRAQEEELESLRRIADSDDKLRAALDEAKRFREENRILKERVNSLMNEKLAAVQAAKRWEKKARALERATA